jgi:nitroreductase
MAVCSTKAIIVNGLSYEKDFHELPDVQMNYKTLTGFMAQRRSVRNFREKSVPDEVIDRILETVSYAPFGAEPGKMHITVVNDRKMIESALPHMARFLDNIVKWIDHPVISRIIRRKNSRETFNTIKNHLYPISALGNYKLEYGDRITRGAPALIIFHADKGAEEHSHNGIIWATYAMLAAQSLGLGATMNSLIPSSLNKVEEVRRIFDIPETHEAVISVILGYPKYKYKRAIRRRSYSIHKQTSVGQMVPGA